MLGTLVTPEAFVPRPVAFAARPVALDFFSTPWAIAVTVLAAFPFVTRRALVARPMVETGSRAIASSCLPRVGSALARRSARAE
ncbi:MAG: hypothetical protein WA813_25565, partial [Beijerinckiaceae bacterium]